MCATKLNNRSLPSCVAVLLSATLSILATASLTNAAPVTLRFEATVDPIVMTPLFDSGLKVNEGDKVVGKFTFEPEVAEGQQSLRVVQPFTASILIDGATLNTPPSIADLTLFSLNDVGIEDFPPARTVDRNRVFSTIGPPDDQSLPNIDANTSSLNIELYGDVSTLLAPSFPADPTVWNAFQFQRSLGVNIRGAFGETQAFFATVNDIVVVPEPATCFLVLTFSSIGAAWRRRRVDVEMQCSRLRQ